MLTGNDVWAVRDRERSPRRGGRVKKSDSPPSRRFAAAACAWTCLVHPARLPREENERSGALDPVPMFRSRPTASVLDVAAASAIEAGAEEVVCGGLRLRRRSEPTTGACTSSSSMGMHPRALPYLLSG